jgi:dihydrofolate synthase/folylpolyglutamate synthase
VEFVAANKPAIERIEPSFFELCVAMAFDHFAREKVDIAIVEVGLGGRLDSTNIITPLLSVITNISYDHQNMLGDTLTLIAGEKAGIIKPGVPVVVGETHAESAPVFLAKARLENAPIVFADQHFTVSPDPGGAGFSQVSTFDVFKNGQPFLPNVVVDTAGPYQQRNLATVIQAWETMQATFPDVVFRRKNARRPDEAALRSGLAQLKKLTRFMGRWEIIGQNPTILCDSAHNEAGLQVAFDTIRLIPHARLHVVTGFVNDKSVENVLGLFPVEARYYFAKADIPRGLEAAILREKAAGFGLAGRAYQSVPNALAAAKRAAAPDDLIVVIGSIFVVAEVLPGR